jgi:excisionase family DNA binding protein
VIARTVCTCQYRYLLIVRASRLYDSTVLATLPNTHAGTERLFYSQEEFADLFGLSVHTVIRDVRLKKIDSRKYGRRVLIPRSEVMRIANEGMK